MEPWINGLWKPLEHTLQQSHSQTATTDNGQQSNTAACETSGSKEIGPSSKASINECSQSSTTSETSVSPTNQTVTEIRPTNSTSTISTSELPLSDSTGPAYKLEGLLRKGGDESLPLSLPTVPPAFLSVKFKEVCRGYRTWVTPPNLHHV